MQGDNEQYSINSWCKSTHPGDVKKRMFEPKDMVAMALKYLSSQNEVKNLYPQIGATASVS
jgi:hypothetical protein